MGDSGGNAVIPTIEAACRLAAAEKGVPAIISGGIDTPPLFSMPQLRNIRAITPFPPRAGQRRLSGGYRPSILADPGRPGVGGKIDELRGRTPAQPQLMKHHQFAPESGCWWCRIQPHAAPHHGNIRPCMSGRTRIAGMVSHAGFTPVLQNGDDGLVFSDSGEGLAGGTLFVAGAGGTAGAFATMLTVTVRQDVILLPMWRYLMRLRRHGISYATMSF